ncbi:hypothetical protein P9112_000861 [Eukaryota sp. TZLM1-RC]
MTNGASFISSILSGQFSYELAEYFTHLCRSSDSENQAILSSIISDLLSSDPFNSKLEEHQCETFLRYVLSALQVLPYPLPSFFPGKLLHQLLRYTSSPLQSLRFLLTEIIGLILVKSPDHSYREVLFDHYCKNKYHLNPAYFNSFFQKFPKAFMQDITSAANRSLKSQENIGKDLIYFLLIQLSLSVNTSLFFEEVVSLIPEFISVFSPLVKFPSEGTDFYLLFLMLLIINNSITRENVHLIFEGLKIVIGPADSCRPYQIETNSDQELLIFSICSDIFWFFNHLLARFSDETEHFLKTYFDEQYSHYSLLVKEIRDGQSINQSDNMIIGLHHDVLESEVEFLQSRINNLFNQSSSSKCDVTSSYNHVIATSPILPASRDPNTLKKQNLVLKGRILFLQTQLNRLLCPSSSPICAVPHDIPLESEESLLPLETSEVALPLSKNMSIQTDESITKLMGKLNEYEAVICAQEAKIVDLEEQLVLANQQKESCNFSFSALQTGCQENLSGEELFTKEQVVGEVWRAVQELTRKHSVMISERDSLLKKLQSLIMELVQERDSLREALQLARDYQS